MKFDLNTELFDAKTKKLIEMAGQLTDKLEMKLARILSSLLLNGAMDEKVSGDVKAKRYALLCKIGNAAESGTVDLTVDEISLLKPLIDAQLPVISHGRVMEVLNAPLPDPAPKA